MFKTIKSKSDLLKDTQIYNTIYLMPGELYYTDSPAIVHTVLGSCLSIVFHYAPLKLSSICHAQLPIKKKLSDYCLNNCPIKCSNSVPDDFDFKYLTCSFYYMIDILKKHNVPLKETSVKIFGGANVIPSSNNQKTIGEENIETAFRLLNDYNLHITSTSIGGNIGRSLYLYTQTGDVFLNQFSSENSETPKIDLL